jgi:glycosyltransferase involved in cell wall biosynthesis
MPPTVAVFIPAYNAAATLGGVLGRIPHEAWALMQDVFVINDGSYDETAAVAEALRATYPRLRLVSFERNRGYGAAVREGLRQCRASGADYAVCLHADGQYPPERIAPFVHHMAEHGIDVLQGSRHRDGTARAGGMPLYKLVAGKALTALENRVFGLSLSDYHSGFMLYSRRALETIPFDRLSTSFDFDLEVIASARRRGLVIAELGIPTRYADEKSHLNPITYGLRCLGVLAGYLRGAYDPPR